MAVRKGRREGDEKMRAYLLLLKDEGREAFINSGRGESNRVLFLLLWSHFISVCLALKVVFGYATTS
jgi:hypothetical protein